MGISGQRLRRWIRRLSLLLAALGMACACSGEGKGMFYVSPAGDDAWSGTLATANGGRTDGPFATLTRARDAVRGLKAKGVLSGPVTVQVRGGRYELAEPLVFAPEDSGSAAAPITYEAYPGETPVLSGGSVVRGWKVDAEGRWVAELPAAPWEEMRLRQIVVNGERRYPTRLPARGYYTVAGLAGAGAKGDVSTPAKRFEFSPGQIRADWRNLTDVEVVLLHFWVDVHLPLAAVDEPTRVVRFSRASRRRLTDDYRSSGARYYVTDVFEALKEPGQWYHDRKAGRLYYLPRPGEDLTRTEVIAPRLAGLVRFAGKPDAGRFVEYLTLRGLTFQETNWDLPATDAGDLQSAQSVPGAIAAEGARHCAILGCTLRNLGTYGIELGAGCRENEIAHNELVSLAAGGLKLSGGAAASPPALRTGANQITDNHLHQLGRVFHSGAGILVMHSDANTLAHNHIHDLYYTGISVGWVWGYGPSVSQGNRIEFNHIHDVGQKMLSDMGGIYTLGVSPGTVIRGNLIHDVDSWGYGGWGIYTDEGSTGILIENNVVYRTKSGGFHQHYGKENVIRNNVFAFAREEQLARSREEAHLSFTFERNVVYFREGPLLGKNWGNNRFVMDRNIYFQADGKPFNFAKVSLEEWRKRGHDVNSLVADPRFADPDKGDFALRPDSPALKLGFQPIDLSSVGPRTK